MKDNYLFYCKECNDLEAGSLGVDYSCGECGKKRISLGITEDDWNDYSEEEARAVLDKAIETAGVSDITAEQQVATGLDEGVETDTNNTTIRNNRVKSVRNTDMSQNMADSTEIKSIDGKVSGLSILAFILSVIGCTGIIGVILGVIDLTKPDNRKKGLSVAAIIIGAALFGVSCFLASYTSMGGHEKKSAEQSTPEAGDNENNRGSDLKINSSYNTETGEAKYVIAGDLLKKDERYYVYLVKEDEGYKVRDVAIPEIDGMMDTGTFSDGDKGLKGTYTIYVTDVDDKIFGSADFSYDGRVEPTPTTSPSPVPEPTEEATPEPTEEPEPEPTEEHDLEPTEDATPEQAEEPHKESKSIRNDLPEGYVYIDPIDLQKYGANLKGQKIYTVGEIADLKNENRVQINLDKEHVMMSSFYTINNYENDLHEGELVAIYGEVDDYHTYSVMGASVDVRECDILATGNDANEYRKDRSDESLQEYFVDSKGKDTGIADSIFGTHEVDKEHAKKISAKKVYSRLKNNQVDCKNRYDGKTVRITGIVEDIGTNIYGQEYVSFETGDPYSLITVQCFFKNDQMDYVAGLQKGQKITLYGVADVGSMSFKVGNCFPAD